LFYRLDVASLRIPPLRERTEDIAVLIEHFLAKYSREYGKSVGGVSFNAMRELLEYPWPGNIRELENKLQTMILRASGPILDLEDISLPHLYAPEPFTPHDFAGAKRRIVDSFEKDYLSQLLTRHRGDMAGAAKEAGKSRTGLWNLIRKHGLSPRNFVDHGIAEMQSDRSI
jgi:DNA-binding NtrC family response regulator